MGRHSIAAAPAKKSKRALVLSIVAAAAVVGVIGSGVYLWVGGHLNPLFASADEPSCENGVRELSVVADATAAKYVTEVAAAFDKAEKGCVETEVRSQESADSAAMVAGGGLEADVWIPDSSVWVQRAGATASSLGRPAPELDARGSVASSPVVFAAPASKAPEIAAEPVTWARVIGGTLPAILPDPEAQAASLAGLYALKGHSSAEDPRQFAGAMIALGKAIPASPSAAFGALPSTPTATVVITSEAQLAAYNLDEEVDPLVAAYPTDGTVALDYPFIVLKDREAEADKAAAAAALAAENADADTEAEFVEKGKPLLERFQQALVDAQKVRAAFGFREPDGTGELDIAGITKDAPVAPSAIDSLAQLDILRSWAVLTLRSRMLAVIDVSGSMEEPAANGLRRIDIFQQAAVGAMSKFSGEVELGVWVFSTARNGDLDYEDLSPIAPLADLAHTQEIQQIIGSLPARLGGATGLYDTTLAAVQRVQETYDPDKVNSVLLFTDGKNEDENGISLDQLIAELQQMHDPKRPVPVIMIGFGPDTDVAAMQQIAQVTGGAAYSAAQPEDLSKVLVDALSQRSCRPNCGG
ncbi:VWA domain-containing protein [Agromyces protaetiae]|uniref:VWA domain-containing protein n=1 Tax=Agromyces protaetiae TaxID=2509455 RepID=A0A4P6FHX7_9MICO|nr:VWA domain-containing protein [Agromyces protaetiae]QAY73547.1 VWA domain-containing protein [Agromyces protaetiae]